MKTKAKKQTDTDHVIVTTEHRGVFFGRLVSFDKKNKVAVLASARMVVKWTEETKGVFGLAAAGPQTGARVTPPCPQLTLEKVTAIAVCSDAAVKQFATIEWIAA